MVREAALRSAVVARQRERGSASRSGVRQCERGCARSTRFNTQEVSARLVHALDHARDRELRACGLALDALVQSLHQELEPLEK